MGVSWTAGSHLLLSKNMRFEPLPQLLVGSLLPRLIVLLLRLLELELVLQILLFDPLPLRGQPRDPLLIPSGLEEFVGLELGVEGKALRKVRN
jgi:hypothetical protein